MKSKTFSSKISNQIKKRTENLSERKNTLSIGSVAKRRRVQLHLTQAQACRDICSISYLSKIESNKIIPNDTYLDMLMERLNIERYELYMLKNADEVMDKVLECYYNFDLEGYKEIFNLCKEYDDNQVADVVKMGYYLLLGEPYEARELINNNISLMNSMTENVFMMYTLFSCEAFLECNNFDEINPVADDLSRLQYNKLFDILCKDFEFRLYVKENRDILAGELYNSLRLLYSQNMFIKRIERISEYYLRILFNAEEYEYIIKKSNIASIGCDYIGEDEYNYIYGVSYFMLGNQYAGIDYLNKINKDSIYFYKAINFFYIQSNNKDEFLNDMVKISKISNNFYLQYFIDKTKNTLTQDIFSSKEYMIALSYSDVAERIKLYKLERDYLIENFRYKDSMLIQKKIDNLSKMSNVQKTNLNFENRLVF